MSLGKAKEKQKCTHRKRKKWFSSFKRSWKAQLHGAVLVPMSPCQGSAWMGQGMSLDMRTSCPDPAAG